MDGNTDFRESGFFVGPKSENLSSNCSTWFFVVVANACDFVAITDGVERHGDDGGCVDISGFGKQFV